MPSSPRYEHTAEAIETGLTGRSIALPVEAQYDIFLSKPPGNEDPGRRDS